MSEAGKSHLVNHGYQILGVSLMGNWRNGRANLTLVLINPWHMKGISANPLGVVTSCDSGGKNTFPSGFVFGRMVQEGHDTNF